jgi:hypothetical protein
MVFELWECGALLEVYCWLSSCMLLVYGRGI